MNLRQKLEIRALVNLIMSIIERLASIVTMFLPKQEESTPEKPARRKILPWRRKDE